MQQITTLTPTYNRLIALAANLTSLTAQDYKSFDVIISDQGNKNPLQNAAIQTTNRTLESHGNSITYLQNKPSKGMAEQRQFLLDHASTSYSLFIDDDLILEPFIVGMLLRTIHEQHCGFVGNPVTGLSYREDVRPDEQYVEFWDSTVTPKKGTPQSSTWQRHKLHNAANPYHISQKLTITPENPRIYIKSPG